jgi:multidrug resistance efflux pump
MNGSLRLRFLIIGLFAFCASVGGAGWALKASSLDGVPVDSNGAADAQVVGFGHVDVESGVVGLAPAQAGRIIAMDVRENQAVRAGDVLLRIDDREAKLRVQQAEGVLKAAEAQLDQAKELPRQHQVKLRMQDSAVQAARHRLLAARHQLDRKRELQQTGNLNASELAAAAELVSEVEAALDVEKDKLRELGDVDPALAAKRVEAEASAAKARLAQAQLALEECLLKAPRAGTILRVQAHVGDLATAQSLQPAILFCPDEARIVRAEVSQEFAHQVRVGAACTIADDSTLDVGWRGKVVRISDWYTHRRSILLEPSQQNDVRTLECIVELDPGQAVVRIGQRMRVTIAR